MTASPVIRASTDKEAAIWCSLSCTRRPFSPGQILSNCAKIIYTSAQDSGNVLLSPIRIYTIVTVKSAGRS